MPQPAQGAWLDDTWIQGVSQKYTPPDPQWMDIAPEVTVDHLGNILKHQKSAYFRIQAGKMAKFAPAPQGSFELTSVAVQTERYGLRYPVADLDYVRSQQNGAAPVDFPREAIELTVDAVELYLEKLVIDTLITTYAATAEDAEGLWIGASSTLFSDVVAQKITRFKNTGRMPNRLLIDATTAEYQRTSSTFQEYVKYTQQPEAMRSRDALASVLAQILGLDKVVIHDGIYSSAVESSAGTEFTGVTMFEFNTGKGAAMLYYYNPTPGLKSTTGFVVGSERLTGGAMRYTRQYRTDDIEATWYESQRSSDIVVLGSDLGFCWKDTHAT